MRFRNRVAVVTGGSQGIGYAAAAQLAAEGAAVAIAAIDGGSAAAEALMRDTGNERVIAVQTDVSDYRQVQAMVEQVKAAFGGIDILVNSAGVQRYGTVVDTDERVWDEVLNINLKGIFLVAKCVIPGMIERGGGAIVNVSSVQATATQQGVAAYTASKGGILSLTRAMAIDHAADRIRVNSVCPASVDTPMLRWAADLFKGGEEASAIVEKWGQMHPLGRVCTAAEVGKLIAYLCSDDAAFITGGEYRIDGGLLAAVAVSLPNSQGKDAI